MSGRPTRRAVLGGGAATLAAAGLPGCADPSEADSAAPVEAGPGQIDHIIVVTMENRSFDHYLGALRLVEGRDEVDGLTGAEVNLDASGAEVRPHPLPEPCQEDLPHSWTSSRRQFNEGANDGFVMAHQGGAGAQSAWAMGYLDRAALPVHYALADAFCVPDRFFCSQMTSTWPNRLYGVCGTSGGMTGNDESRAPFTLRSIYQALDEAGHDWAHYYSDVPFIGLLADHWQTERIGLLDDFVRACERGALPAFTTIDPGFSFNDDHPPHHPGPGQLFLATVYEALARSPLWERSLLVITYDEHGGFYDHVPPPLAADDHAAEGFDQLGFRVPALLVGPWVRQGVVHEVFDNTSVLRYACERFGLTPWTARIAGANSLALALDADRMARNAPLAPPVLPFFEVPAEQLTEACEYAFRRRPGGAASGQPELERLIARVAPAMSRLHEGPALVEGFLGTARRLGLIS